MDKKVIIILLAIIAILIGILMLKITGVIKPIETGRQIQESAQKSVNEVMVNAQSMEQEIFNKQFELYQGLDINGTSIKQLEKIVKESNENDLEHKVELILDETNEEDRYNVELQYNDEGYVNKIIVTGK